MNECLNMIIYEIKLAWVLSFSTSTGLIYLSISVYIIVLKLPLLIHGAYKANIQN